MWAKIKKMLNDFLTGIDNTTFDIGRGAIFTGIGSFIGAVVMFMAMSFYLTFYKDKGDLQQFSTSFGVLIAAFGAFVTTCAAGIALKSKTEPKGGDNGTP